MSEQESSNDVHASGPTSPGNSCSSASSSSNNSPVSVVVVASPSGSVAPTANTSPVAVSVITSPLPRLEAADGALPVSAQPTASAALPSMLRSILSPPDGAASVNNTANLGNMPLLSSLINPNLETSSDSIEANIVQTNNETSTSTASPSAPLTEVDLSVKVEPLSPPGLPPLPTAFLASPSPQASSQCYFEAPVSQPQQEAPVNPATSSNITNSPPG